MAVMARSDEVRAYWFGAAPADEAALVAQYPLWFTKRAETDTEIRARFGDLVEEALAGGLEGWEANAGDGVALVLLLDQFTRNIFRDTPRAFAGDGRALALAGRLAEQDDWQTLSPVEQAFVLMPYMHAEDVEAQRHGVAAFERLAAGVPAGPLRGLLDNMTHYAVLHRDIIERFGRFPHRNRILGRETTAEEAEFLTQPNSSF